MRYILMVLVALIVVSCAQIRQHRQINQPVNTVLMSSIGGILFRLNKIGDLPNVYGGRDIWGGKVDKGYAEMKLAGIDGEILILEVVDVSRQSLETVMDRYKPFQSNAVVSVDVENSIVTDSQKAPNSIRINLDTTKQKDVVISGIRVTFIEVQPYSIRYTLEDLRAQ